MKKLLTIATLSLCLAALTGSSIAIAGAGGLGSPARTSISLWVIWLGASQGLDSTVVGTLPWDGDTILILPSEEGVLHVEVKDGTAEGTLGALVVGPCVHWQEATTPDAIQMDFEIGAWWPVLLMTGYVDSEGFPARYHVAASLSEGALD